MQDRSPVIRQAVIKPEAIRYHLWGIVIFSVITVVGILLLPITWPLSKYLLERYYQRLEVVLTRRDLKVRRGIISTEEKSIPLEQITDLALNQGPLMRLFDIKGMRVETAGQSATGALVTVVGLADVDNFRDAVLDQRDRISDDDSEPSSSTSTASPATDHTSLLTDIRDTLKRIEEKLDTQSSSEPSSGT
ncbi:PH domain-containing protein [Wenzhouxiangella sp. AB-CW3]|uniref:PH domain-containing protein n=1 Tax=Wenzhouxiangella sp. AB-CW3 TaxID=2771012 RepID=UPI00168BD400|nr:PH domain-containing protein [Wenzhouxiangella sp. AB-CW3]QOC21468.1 PH domain-containing protein [Wenzhouxiangella sp. AB-CW3]